MYETGTLLLTLRQQKLKSESYLSTLQYIIIGHPIMNSEKIDGGGGGGNNNNNNKLRDGPCAKQYLDLEACAVEKKENVKSHRVSQVYNVLY